MTVEHVWGHRCDAVGRAWLAVEADPGGNLGFALPIGHPWANHFPFILRLGGGKRRAASPGEQTEVPKYWCL